MTPRSQTSRLQSAETVYFVVEDPHFVAFGYRSPSKHCTPRHTCCEAAVKGAFILGEPLPPGATLLLHPDSSQTPRKLTCFLTFVTELLPTSSVLWPCPMSHATQVLESLPLPKLF